VPTLDAASGSRPVLGSTFTLALGNLPFAVGFVGMGLSDTAHGPFTLPFDLSQFGMPGCHLRAEALATQFVVGTGTSASWSLALPSATSFLGVVFFNQAFSFDPTANAAGLTVTNGGRARIGT
jgi:hypothetical protein